MNWRIVVNDQSGRYRIEIRRWWGWGFALDDLGDSYRSFDAYQDARLWGCQNLKHTEDRTRRWRIVDLCCSGCPSG